MSDEHFVGRNDLVKRVQDVLTGAKAAGGNLTILSIEGPGGIGKTCLFDHAIERADLTDRNYLILRTNGSEPSARGPRRPVARMVDGASAEVIRGKPSGYYFPSVDRVVKTMDAIKAEAAAEFQRRHPNDKEGRMALLRFIDLAFEAGERLNNAIPITKQYVDFRQLGNTKTLIEETVPLLVALQQQAAPFWELLGAPFLGLLGLGDNTTLKNSVKENACQPLSDALFSDLAAVLVGYEGKDLFRPAHAKMKGIDRLLLILDDYEALQDRLGKFLVDHLLPSLQTARFHSVVVVLGRDQLAATHPGWDQHFKPNLLERIDLAPLSRSEMDKLVDSYGEKPPEEKERAWRDTQGYPLYVQHWIEEAAAGGRTAVILQRFFDRTTRWMDDRQKDWLLHALFLDEVNVRTMQAMIGDEEQGVEAVDWFKRDGSGRDTSAPVFRVREYVRSRLIDYLRICDPARHDQLLERGRLASKGRSDQPAPSGV